MKAYRRGYWTIAASAALLAGMPVSLHASHPAKHPAMKGFVSLFDGKTLKGWRGDPALWSVRDGAITGGSDVPIKLSSFLISNRSFANFEVHFKYRFVKDGNSGFQFRSTVSDEAKFNVAGYQANVVPPDQEARYGMLYDNLGRQEIGLLGEHVEISSADGKLIRDVKNSVNPMATLRGAYRPYPEWNDYVVIAFGNHIVHAINGYLVLDAVDDDPKAAKQGIFALQIDFGQPMTVQFKDIAVKSLKAAPTIEGRFISVPGPAETTAAIPKRPSRTR